MDSLVMPKEAAERLGWLRRGLVASDASDFEAPEWLEPSYADAASFWHMAAPCLMAAPIGTSRSSFGERYNLFHELGERHVNAGSPAFAVHADGRLERELSYEALAERATALAGVWRALGLEPQQSVAIVQRFSTEYAVALLAAFHVGAVVTAVPAWGRSFIRARLAALEPDFVVTSAGRAEELGLDEKSLLPLMAVRGAESVRAAAYGYGAAEPAMRLFSPLGADPLKTSEVGAEALYLYALADGVLSLRLDPGSVLAAPGFCEWQFKPAFLLACLAAGASFLDAPADVVNASAAAFLERVQVLGVTPRTRDALLSAHAKPGARLQRWLRNPAHEFDPLAWRAFSESQFGERLLGMNYFANGPAGDLLFSAWRNNPGNNAVLKSPGRSWKMMEVNQSGMEVLGDTGLMACADPALDANATGQLLLGTLGGEQVFLAALGAHRAGQRLPVQEICDVVRGAHEEIWECSAVDFAKDSKTTEFGCALISFLAPTGTATGTFLTDRVRETIEVELDESFLPDRFESFHLAPRWDEAGDVDQSWCRSQYLSGLLAMKESEPLFQSLARLRFEQESEKGG